MLNIISNSLQSKKTRGPKKVVENLIKGLEKINYPYTVNGDISKYPRTWIHDDLYTLSIARKKAPDSQIIVGPNIFVNPEDISPRIDMTGMIYLQPSEMVKNIWVARGYASRIEVWPAGIDTDAYCSTREIGDRNKILIYFKNRSEEELGSVMNILRSKNIVPEIIRYGSYKEVDYLDSLRQCRYMIWLGGYESQGIALEEALSCDIPIIVIDRELSASPFDKDSTAAPYFSDECGIKIKKVSDLSAALDQMDARFNTYTPRKYVLDNLSLEKSARRLIEMFNQDKNNNKLTEITSPEHQIQKISIIKRIIREILLRVRGIK